MLRIQHHRYHSPPLRDYVILLEMSVQQGMLLGMRVVPAGSDTIRGTSPVIASQLSFTRISYY